MVKSAYNKGLRFFVADGEKSIEKREFTFWSSSLVFRISPLEVRVNKWNLGSIPDPYIFQCIVSTN